ncbi:cell adhesion molecule Dscam1-like [Drosophila takahashii]|uniref:cell adhesion molecule Dscam1-like n=1 Tax=Drosophila takahashii TaxID=29030 RepID=UPI0038996292
MNAFNKIGRSASSDIKIIKTKGMKPIAPTKQNFILLNVTSISLDLSSWLDGGCSITYFSIEYRFLGPTTEWIMVSNKIESNAWYTIGDLDSGASYNLRVTAHNNAGSTNESCHALRL